MKVTLLVISAFVFSNGADSSFSRIESKDLCITNGAVSTSPDGRLAIDTPSSRAVLRIASEPAAEIRFRYLGATAGSKPLASGGMRSERLYEHQASPRRRHRQDPAGRIAYACAELHGTDLRVIADGRPVWEGTVGDAVKEFDGPVGFRTDNARFVFDYFVRGVRKGAESMTTGSERCHPSPGD